MDNLQLRQRIVRSMIRVSERTANMRKPEKFEYRKHMTAAFMDMLELCIEANRARGSRRVELQNKMDTKLDVLRSLVDTAVSPEDRLISPGLHEIWSKELNEIGRMPRDLLEFCRCETGKRMARLVGQDIHIGVRAVEVGEDERCMVERKCRAVSARALSMFRLQVEEIMFDHEIEKLSALLREFAVHLLSLTDA